MGVSVKKVNFAYERVPILKDVSFELPKGKMTALIGPNGSGKSTLLKTMLGLEKPSIGHVCLDGKNISEMRHRDRAKKLAFLSQFPSLQDHMTVEDLVKLGRQHNKRFLKPPSKEDMDHVQRALDWVGLAGQADTSVLSLSGGQRQRQRAFLAMVLAQDTDYIFLDEPTSYLDIRYQIEFIELVSLDTMVGTFTATVVYYNPDLDIAVLHAPGMNIATIPWAPFAAESGDDAVVTSHVEMDWMAISSYGSGTQSSGVVRILKDLGVDIEGRHVIVVEDIIDTGLTLSYLISNLVSRKPASLEIMTMFRKPGAAKMDVPVKYVGFDIPNDFVVGYGLDYAGQYRNLKDLAILAPHVYQ